jgi:hypothetical protein
MRTRNDANSTGLSTILLRVHPIAHLALKEVALGKRRHVDGGGQVAALDIGGCSSLEACHYRYQQAVSLR